jgi:hypothetical protein
VTSPLGGVRSIQLSYRGSGGSLPAICGRRYPSRVPCCSPQSQRGGGRYRRRHRGRPFFIRSVTYRRWVNVRRAVALAPDSFLRATHENNFLFITHLLSELIYSSERERQLPSSPHARHCASTHRRP